MAERGLSLARRVGFAWRLLRRDLSSGRLLVMLLAATLAVASTVSVDLLVTRVEQTMLAESSALLAGDLALVTREPSPDGAVADARRHGLDVPRTASLRSVVAVGEALQLVQLKAVDEAYPLRGRLLVAPALHAAAQPAVHGPPAGEVWADARLFQLLDLEVGTGSRSGQRPCA